MIHLVKMTDHSSFKYHACQPHQQWREDQRPPIADAQVIQQHPGHEGAHHELRAMGEVDDVEQPENNREAE